VTAELHVLYSVAVNIAELSVIDVAVFPVTPGIDNVFIVVNFHVPDQANQVNALLA
jgi:hypothetical protein